MKLTLREQEIVNVLKKNPLISQEDLANIFGITRSSVAVHISNLMKKGIIIGRGYVFNEEASITILGECLLEINITHEPDNKAIIDMQYRKTPIEMATVFCNYGVKPKILTFLGNDEVGGLFLKQMQDLELDTSTIFKHSSKRSGRQVYINGRLTYNEIMSEEDYNKAINAREWAILNCDWLIVENRFSPAVIERVLAKKTDKSPHLCTFLQGNLEYIPPYLSDFSIVVWGVENISENRAKINQLLELDIDPEQIFIITDGHSEILVINNNKTSTFSLLPNQNFSIEEKIPAFLAGFIYASLNNYPLRQAIRIAIGSM